MEQAGGEREQLGRVAWTSVCGGNDPDARASGRALLGAFGGYIRAEESDIRAPRKKSCQYGEK